VFFCLRPRQSLPIRKTSRVFTYGKTGKGRSFPGVRPYATRRTACELNCGRACSRCRQSARFTPPEQLAENRQLVAAVETVDKAEFLGRHRELVFQMDGQTKRPVIRVVDRDSGEVLLQVPPEYVLDLARQLQSE
jgi:uncharacterized FlaG/YvyC family protein